MNAFNLNRQRGATLFIGLMFLLLLTILGLSSSNVSIMQERMAGNVSETNLAFQSAERTLREIEWRLSQLAVGGSGGLGTIPTWDEMGLERSDCTMSEWDWNNPSWLEAPDTGNGYLVVDLSDYEVNGEPFGSSCRPVSEVGMNTAGEYFLIVARAESPSGTSEAIVQSIFYWPQ
jgi:type IV pilus assembly protein PilX